MKKLLKLIWEATPMYYIFKSLQNLNDAAGGTIFHPDSLNHLDKADEFIKLKNSKTKKNNE